MTPDDQAGNERGQSGIGTLILLIAAILVATMTVGVFFDVAGLLSGETSSTSEDISDKFSGRIQIVSVSGHVSNGAIDRVNITLKQSSSDGSADLREATVQWAGPNSVRTYVWSGANESGPTYTLSTYNEGGPTGVLSSGTDRAILTIEPPAPLTEGETVSFTLIGASETSHQFRIPSPVPTKSSVGL